jgi:putative ABC transport system ATP-binding protein
VGSDARADVPALRATGVAKTFDDGSRALAGVDLEVPRRRFVAVMGPSGSGKSTLLHLLGALDRPSAGAVEIDGRRISDLGEPQLTLLRRSTIGFVFQAFNLVPVLSVADNVALPALIAGRRAPDHAPRLERALAAVGLAEHAGRLASRLSGGEQQRVAIARALFAEPTIVLADEPTGNLDTRTGAQVLRLLRAAGDKTVVMVTHDPGAAAVADEVLLLADGRVRDRLVLDRVAANGDRTAAVLAWLAGAMPAAAPGRTAHGLAPP